jgi:hypothetical protein
VDAFLEPEQRELALALWESLNRASSKEVTEGVCDEILKAPQEVQASILGGYAAFLRSGSIRA